MLQPVVVGAGGRRGRHRSSPASAAGAPPGSPGLERVPAVVRAVDDRERLELALVENLVREDLTPIDVAQACAT